MSNKKVSICIPTYNQSTFLEEAIESALSQTMDNIEIVVSNNHSTDNTNEILKKYQENPKIKIIKPPTFLKMAENWAFCIAHVFGEYINLLSSDDMLYPEFSLEQSKLMDDDSKLSFVYSAAETINIKGETIGSNVSFFSEIKRTREKEIGRFLYASRSPLLTALIRRDLYDKVGGFDPYYDLIGDWDLWLRLLMVGNCKYNPKVLAKYRVWDTDDKARSRRIGKQIEETVHLYDKFEKNYAKLSETIKKVRKKKAYQFMFLLSKIDDPYIIKDSLTCLRKLNNSIFFRLVSCLCKTDIRYVVKGIFVLKVRLEGLVKKLLIELRGFVYDR